MVAYLDTYAILAILDGHTSYAKFQRRPAIAHSVNLLEACVALLRRGETDPMKIVASLRLGETGVEPEDVALAARLKVEFGKPPRSLSLVDALGYAIARRRGWPFVTGDRGFRGLPGVEFVPTD